MKKIIEELERIVGKKWVVTERELMEDYLRDETPDPIRPSPAAEVVLVKVETTEQISSVLKLVNREGIPLFPVGGRTGIVGGAIPTESGVILSLERMNRVEIDQDNLMAVAEAGVTLGALIKAAEDLDLFFPLHPGDEGAQVGGLIATNAGGVRAVKYGVMRNYVKGIEVVLPTGEVVNLEGKLLKNNTGYNLMHLIIGSEGTLGIITKAVVKLYSRPKFNITLLATFGSRHYAIKSVLKILRSGITPLAIEYVERKDIEKAAKHLNEEWPVKKGEAQLIIILTEMSEDELFSECEEISEICEENKVDEVRIAETKEEQDKILRIRSSLYTALKPEVYDVLDVTVPPSRLMDLMNDVDKVAEKYGSHLPLYGHVGDGNLHVHIMKQREMGEDYIEKVKREIYEAGVDLGGVITGEHGIGKIRVNDLNLVLSEKEMELMKAIKNVFDPNNILNPGKTIR